MAVNFTDDTMLLDAALEASFWQYICLTNAEDEERVNFSLLFNFQFIMKRNFAVVGIVPLF